MSLTENSNQLFFLGGATNSQNSPYISVWPLHYIHVKLKICLISSLASQSRQHCSDVGIFANSGEMCSGIVLVLALVLAQEKQPNRPQHLICVRLTDQVSFYDRERSGSVVECSTRDRGAAGSSLTGVTALCP